MTTTPTARPTGLRPATGALIGAVLHARTTSHGAHLAAFRAAAHPATEPLAYTHTERHLTDLKRHEQHGLRRAAGLCAHHDHLPQQTRPTDGTRVAPRRLGHTLAAAFRAERGCWPSETHQPTAIGQQVAALPLMDLESMTVVVSTILARVPVGTPVDWFSIARAFADWGTGLTERSHETRKNVLTDYFTNTTPRKA